MHVRDNLSKLRFEFWKKKVGLISTLQRVSIDPARLLWVNPQRIINVGVGWGNHCKLHEFGKVVGGDWDLNSMPFADLSVYQSFEARFVRGVKWENTSYHEIMLAALAQGVNPWGVSSKSDLTKRLDSLDVLFWDIQKNGYKTQQQLMAGKISLRGMDEVTARISRNGEFLFEDGRHRLAIAKILGLSQIPVAVTWRHREWVTFRAELLQFIKNRHDGKAHYPLTHPDLSDIPSLLQEEVFRLIKSHMKANGHSLLHIGAHWGYFCHKFEDEGYHCYAVEEDPKHYHFLTKLKIADNRRFTTTRSDICTIFEKSDYDVVLALKSLNRYLRTAESYNRFVEFLKRLRTSMMFFAPDPLLDGQMQGAYRSYSYTDLVRVIAKYTGLTHYECIGHIERSTPIYKLTRV